MDTLLPLPNSRSKSIINPAPFGGIHVRLGHVYQRSLMNAPNESVIRLKATGPLQPVLPPMKHHPFHPRAVLIGLGLLAHAMLFAQCPTGDVLITSQTDVATYATNFPNCDTLPGDLVFSGTNIDDLSAFGNVEVILGDLRYTSTFPGPYDFTGFQSLTHVGGDLDVYDCQRWRSFAGLDNLQRVGGSVQAQYVDSIEGVSGLFNLDHIGGDLLIWGGPLMFGLSGLNDLDTVMGQLQVLMGNASGALPDQLEYVGGDFRVTGGTNQLTGAAQLMRIDGHLLLGSPNLPAPNAFPVLGVVHDLVIGLDDVSAINLNILPALDTVVNNLEVGANSMLTSFAGLNNVDYVGGWLLFDDCEDLVTITNAFQSVDTCGKLWIDNNDVLTDLSAFDRAMGIGSLQVTNNPQLAYCHVQAICERVVPPILPNPAIYGNATGCDTEFEIYDLCTLGTEVPDVSAERITVFPNPAQDVLRIGGISGTRTVHIHGPDGRTVCRTLIDGGALDLRQLPAGMYALRVDGEPHILPVVFVKR